MRYGRLERAVGSNVDKTCKLEGCNEEAYCKEYCISHYQQSRTGEPSLDRKSVTHGGTKKGLPTRTYDTWHYMRNYRKATGVIICKRWDKSFADFREDMGERPKKMHLHRIDESQGYTCGSCEECVSQGWQRNCSWELQPSHGHNTLKKGRTKTYNSWSSMIDRCTRTYHQNYKHYGGRGITICPRWRNDFSAFLEDMGERPEGMTLDRINNDGNYSCGKCEQCLREGWTANCRWATPSQQRLNQRERKTTNKGEDMSSLVENIDKEIKAAKVQVKELEKEIKILERAKTDLQNLGKEPVKKVTKPRVKAKKPAGAEIIAEQIQNNLRNFVTSDA
jgi:hypothetical protein